MAGHNKWKQIKEKKTKTDAQKSKQFSKFSRLIAEEALRAKGDQSAPGLRAAVDRARSINMPNDAIDRAIKKVTGVGATSLEIIIYETYGPGGCAIIIETLTDNRNRAAQEIKHVLSKNGYSLAGMGSVTWAFEKIQGSGWKPTSTITLSDEDISSLGKLVDELEESNEVQEIFTNAE